MRDPGHVREGLGGYDGAPLLELQVGNDAEQVGVARPFAVAVRGALHVRDAGVDGGEGVGDGAGGVVVAVDAEPRVRGGQHLGDDVGQLARQHAAVRVAEGDDVGARLGGDAHDLERVRRVGPVAVEEVLGVEEHPLPLGTQVGHRVADHREVLGERRTQGEVDVPVVRLGHERHHRGAGLAQGHDGRVVGRDGPGPARRPEGRQRRVLEVQLGTRPCEELGVLGVRAGPAALDEADAEVVQVPRDRQLVRPR